MRVTDDGVADNWTADDGASEDKAAFALLAAVITATELKQATIG